MLSPPCGGVEQPGEILERRKIDDFKKLGKFVDVGMAKREKILIREFKISKVIV